MNLNQLLDGLSKEEKDFIRTSVFKGKTTQEWLDECKDKAYATKTLQDAITFGHLNFINKGGEYQPIEDMDVKKLAVEKFTNKYKWLKWSKWISWGIIAFGAFIFVLDGGIGVPFMLLGFATWGSLRSVRTYTDMKAEVYMKGLLSKKNYEKQRRDNFERKVIQKDPIGENVVFPSSTTIKLSQKKSKYQTRLEELGLNTNNKTNKRGPYKRKDYIDMGPS